MQSITLTADENLIAAAQARAQAEHTTLDEVFGRWLADYVERTQRVAQAMTVIGQLRTEIDTSGPKPAREERNAR